MKCINYYRHLNETGEEIFSLIPTANPADCECYKQITADVGNQLVNIKTETEAIAILIPEWEEKNWIERAL